MSGDNPSTASEPGSTTPQDRTSPPPPPPPRPGATPYASPQPQPLLPSPHVVTGGGLPDAVTSPYATASPRRRWSVKKRLIVVFSVIGLLVALFLGIFFGLGRLLELATESVGETVPHTAEIGECYEIGVVGPVSCAGAHHYEVIFVQIYALESDRPGTWERLGVTGVCDAPFRDWTGEDWVDSDLDVALVVPSVETWAAGERRTVCVLHDATFELLDGSARAE